MRIFLLTWLWSCSGGRRRSAWPRGGTRSPPASSSCWSRPPSGNWCWWKMPKPWKVDTWNIEELSRASMFCLILDHIDHEYGYLEGSWGIINSNNQFYALILDLVGSLIIKPPELMGPWHAGAITDLLTIDYPALHHHHHHHHHHWPSDHWLPNPGPEPVIRGSSDRRRSVASPACKERYRGESKTDDDQTKLKFVWHLRTLPCQLLKLWLSLIVFVK